MKQVTGLRAQEEAQTQSISCGGTEEKVGEWKEKY